MQVSGQGPGKGQRPDAGSQGRPSRAPQSKCARPPKRAAGPHAGPQAGRAGLGRGAPTARGTRSVLRAP